MRKPCSCESRSPEPLTTTLVILGSCFRRSTRTRGGPGPGITDMEAPSPAPPVVRITAIATVRGFAVLGILIMNVVGMAIPSAAYGDPRAYGGSGGADLIAWLAAFVTADGKLRGLVPMLFGASMAIVADRAAARGGSPGAVHYQGVGWGLGKKGGGHVGTT